MSKLLCLISFVLLALCAYTAIAATTSRPTSSSNSNYDDRGRYNPYQNDPYYNSRYNKNRDYYQNRDYYNNRQYYDNHFKHYNPSVVSGQARILDQEFQTPQDGAYYYSFESENGVHADERGVPVKVGTEEQKQVVEGSYSYVSPEGLRVIVRYTADENGFHPTITYGGYESERFTRTQQPADIVINKEN